MDVSVAGLMLSLEKSWWSVVLGRPRMAVSRIAVSDSLR